MEEEMEEDEKKGEISKKLATKIKLLAHIIKNVRTESGFRIIGSRVIHNIIRTLSLFISQPCFPQYLLYSQSGSL